jgi:acyl carrier protein
MPPLFAELARATPARQSRPASADEGAAFRQRLAAAPGSERQGLLMERLTQHVARVMGMDLQTIDTGRSLSDLGIDSLMAVELKNRIDGDLRGSIPVTTLLAGPSIEELAGELAGQLDQPASAVQEPAGAMSASNGHPSSPEDVLANLDQLSDDDVTALLDAMLQNQGGN